MGINKVKKYFLFQAFFCLVLACVYNYPLYAQSINIEDLEKNKELISSINNPLISSPDPISRKSEESTSSLDTKDEVTIDNNFDASLERFGSSFFKKSPSTFLPINDPSSNSGYILDVDDVVLIMLIGDRSESYEYRIDRSGNIAIDDIGYINIAGLSLEDANLLVNNRLEEFFVGTKSVLSLKEVRDIQILVSGHVLNPGVYILSGYSNILHAIIHSGGITRNGSYRNIIIKRPGKEDHEIDLYNFFVNGDITSNISLRTGDSVIVMPTVNNIPIIGAIARPAIYEFKNGETASDLINIAGGVAQDGDSSGVLLSRSGDQSNQLIFKDMNIDLIKNDRIYIPFLDYQPNLFSLKDSKKFIDKYIEISGEVKRPGKYYIKDGEKFSDIVKKFGGYTENAYIFGGVRISQEARSREEEYNDKLYQDALKSLMSSSDKMNSSSALNFMEVLKEFKNIKPTGRVVTEFDNFKIQNDPLLDSVISHGDLIHIPKKTNVVYIFGEVLNPGAVLFEPGNNINDYIDIAGGLSSYADKKSIILVQANGLAYRNKNIRNIFGEAPNSIDAGSVIYIPRDLSEIDGLQLAAVVSPIISSLALSIASINSIKN